MCSQPVRDGFGLVWQKILDQKHHVFFVRLECGNEARQNARKPLGLVGAELHDNRNGLVAELLGEAAQQPGDWSRGAGISRPWR